MNKELENLSNKLFKLNKKYKKLEKESKKQKEILDSILANPFLNVEVKTDQQTDQNTVIDLSDTQTDKMIYDPATGNLFPVPDNINEYRKFHGRTAWLYNPWTGNKRHPSDIGSDVFGYLIMTPNER